MLIKKSWFEEAENRVSDDGESYLPDLYIKMEDKSIILMTCFSYYQDSCVVFQSRQAVEGFIKSLIKAKDTVFK